MRAALVAFAILLVPYLASASPASILFSQIGEAAGTVAGENTHFQIIDSDYLNISLDSVEPIKLRLESQLETVFTDVASGLQFAGE